MNLSLNRRLLAQEALSDDEAQALQRTAQALKRATEAGSAPPTLRGKNIALLCVDPACRPAADFESAATRLGARVSRIVPDPALVGGDERAARKTARMLGRLYDAIESDELSAAVATRLQHEAGVPVFNGIAREGHPLHKVPHDEADRAYLLQALLLASLDD